VFTLSSDGSVKFCIAAKNSNYIDLANTFLNYVRASVTTGADANLADDVETAPERNFLHTLWSQCDLFLNGTLVTQSNNN